MKFNSCTFQHNKSDRSGGNAMLQSMTGFGSATAESDQMSVTVEVKTLNSKFFDIYCRIPKNYSSREIEIRNMLTQALERGKIELMMSVQIKSDSANTSVNRGLVKTYFKDLLNTAQELQFEPNLTDLLRIATMMPNAYNTDVLSEEKSEEEWSVIKRAVQQAIEKCQEFRKQDGKAVELKLKEYIDTIGDLLEKVAEQDPKRIPIIRERIEKSIVEWFQNENFDRNRFEQELIYYIEKFDVSEEKVRLKNHLDYFLKELQTASNGKRLNFISQEIGREVNTIGSKANDAIIQHYVVQMKDELEKIKEQTMNIV